jgi:hypothetical protein
MSDTVYCSICLNEVPESDIYITPCKHEFCIKCLFDYIQHDKFRNVKIIPCPLCRANIKSILDPFKYNIFIKIMCCACYK